MSEKKYTRDQIKDAIWQELKESDYTGENNDRAYEIIGIVMAGIDKIIVGDEQPGAVWVKATEFKYEVGTAYHAKDSQSKGAGRFNKDGAFIWGDGTLTWPVHRDDLYVLDESGTAAGREEEFASWVDDNLIYRDTNGHWYKWNNGKAGYYANDTKHLYELFKQKEK